MLRIYYVMLEAIRMMAPLIRQIRRHSRPLADQTERAATSVALNLAEGSGSRGGIRQARYGTALGSARENVACLQSAECLQYIGPVSPELMARLDQVIGTLVNITT